MKYFFYSSLLLLFIISSPRAESQQNWSFEDLKTGTVPENWESAETKGKGQKAIWETKADDSNAPGKKVLAITNNTNRGDIGNLLFIKHGVFQNVEFSTKVKAGAIGQDAGGGVVWRAIDENHYYSAQWNASANTLRLYVYIGGKPSLLESVSVEADPDAWHQIDIVHNEESIEISFDSEPKISVEDKQLDFKGWIGLWAQGSATPLFDDVTFYSEEDAEEE